MFKSVSFYSIRNIKFTKRQSHRGKDSGIVLQKIYQVTFFFAKQELYYWLGLETQQISPRVKQNCCYPRSQSITVLLCTFICFQNCLFPLTNKNYILPLTFVKSENLNDVTSSYFDIVTSIDMICWTNEKRPSVNSSIEGNRSMNRWSVNRTLMQRKEIFGIVLYFCICFK